MYSLSQEEVVNVSDSDRRCSLKIVTKGRDIRKVLKYSIIESKKQPNNGVIPEFKQIQRPPSKKPAGDAINQTVLLDETMNHSFFNNINQTTENTFYENDQ
jgi:hypothetical protein